MIYYKSAHNKYHSISDVPYEFQLLKNNILYLLHDYLHSFIIIQLSKNGNDLKNAIDTFFRLIGRRLYGKDNEDEERRIRVKQMTEENESYKTEIALLMDQMENMAIDYDQTVREYEADKKLYDERLKNARQEADINKIQIE